MEFSALDIAFTAVSIGRQKQKFPNWHNSLRSVYGVGISDFKDCYDTFSISQLSLREHINSNSNSNLVIKSPIESKNEKKSQERTQKIFSVIDTMATENKKEVEEAIQRLLKEKEKLIINAKNVVPFDISNAILKLKEAKVETKDNNTYFSNDMPIMKLIGRQHALELQNKLDKDKMEMLKKPYFGKNYYVNMNKEEKSEKVDKSSEKITPGEKQEKNIKQINDENARRIREVYNTTYSSNIMNTNHNITKRNDSSGHKNYFNRDKNQHNSQNSSQNQNDFIKKLSNIANLKKEKKELLDKFYEMDKKLQNSYMLYNVNVLKKNYHK